MNLFFRLLGCVFAVLFSWAAYVQNNDPDATAWYIIYGFAAFASILFAIKRLPFVVAILLGLAALIGTYKQWPTTFEGFTIGKGDIENIERGREAFGLLIIAVMMILYALRIRFEKKFNL
ncbi:hypothetical protein LCGC14_1636050 [marine sediment metagenome]|uniref:Transmembrane family 220, helix n=2 Tax=root TaxID=1 RepID=A0A831VXE8_9FLAO|nr:hypothetical protein [Pricia antarctica]